ncbi:glycine zipper 2TM domain-containing protein [Luteimonas huabeiensis]|uniref:glycine zipper 2TM domain-containing protein n=1 Tax=Luteimonas huabeiensis TaxID=1244513 RepID=UPI000466C100|nr:glycine zipper 2TM domain-containing protein [Luteimonas huabeiensis]
MKNNTLAIALASLLVGGVAVAAFQNNRDDRPAGEGIETVAGDTLPAGGRVEYADVVRVEPVTERQDLYATVLGSEPIRETTTHATPREVCEDVVVQERLPERDGNVGGTVAGAIIGGLVGNQIGGGNGRKLATAAGATAGGFIGNRVDRNHVGGRVVERVDRQCRTVQDSSQSSRVVAYDVTYRNPDGSTGTLRTDSKPGERIKLGTEDVPVAYEVTYRYGGQERTVRMDQRPGERLPVLDGQVVTQTAAIDASDRLQ